MNNGDNSKGSKSQEGSDVKAYPLSEDEHIRETPGPRYGNTVSFTKMIRPVIFLI